MECIVFQKKNPVTGAENDFTTNMELWMGKQVNGSPLQAR
jgi:hypothetical protein